MGSLARSVFRRISGAIIAVVSGCAVLGTVQAVLAGDRNLLSLFSSPGLIRQGDRSDRVRYLQEVLQACGYKVSQDGVFGPLTESAVKDFQRENGLHADGVVGPLTMKELERVYLRTNPPDKHTVKPGDLDNRKPLRRERRDSGKDKQADEPDMVYAGRSSPYRPPSPFGNGPFGSGSRSRALARSQFSSPPPPFPCRKGASVSLSTTGPTTTRPILAILRQYGQPRFSLSGIACCAILSWPEKSPGTATSSESTGLSTNRSTALRQPK